MWMRRRGSALAQGDAAVPEGRTRQRAAGLRWGFAVTFTATLVVMLAASGGIGYAASSSKSAIAVVKRVVAPAKKKGNQLPVAKKTSAHDQYKLKCNAGRGNWSEYPPNTTRDRTRSRTLVDPHAGERGPGPRPTDDCDPGNSGEHNRGGD